jgi:hypothetical protein
VQLLPYTSRKVSAVQLKYSLKGGNSGQFPGIKAITGVTRSDFFNGYAVYGPGQYGTTEFFKELHTATAGLNQTVAVDTGALINVSQDFYGATHVWLRIPEAPTGTVDGGITLNEVHYTLDNQHKGWPVTKWDATLHGYGVDTFPVVLTWKNLTDLYEHDGFSIWPMLNENVTATYDGGTYTVTNAPLIACSYEKTVWLRLVPGVNTIRVVGVAGVGQVEFKVKWKNKN